MGWLTSVKKKPKMEAFAVAEASATCYGGRAKIKRGDPKTAPLTWPELICPGLLVSSGACRILHVHEHADRLRPATTTARRAPRRTAAWLD
jgi:hypothetical protein